MSKSNLRAIFLDIDGVLNHELWYEYRHNNNLPIGYVDETQLDPACIERLNKLVSDTGSIVVLSSTWRKGSTLDEMNNLFSKVGATFKFSGMTGVCCSGIRGVEIYNWIQRRVTKEEYGIYPSDFKKYVILDDDSDMLLWQKDNFFQVSPYDGLTQEICDKAKEFLLSI